MAIQSTPYKNAPDIGYPGQITDIMQPYLVRHSIAEVDLDVGLAIIKGANVTDPTTPVGFKVKWPVGASASGNIIGITVRSPELEVTPQNDIDGVPIYRAGDLVRYLVRGSIYVKVVGQPVVTARSTVYFVRNPVNYPLGTILPWANDGYARILQNAYFEKPTPVGGIVKVVIKK
jgi:hypothetical protein